MVYRGVSGDKIIVSRGSGGRQPRRAEHFFYHGDGNFNVLCTIPQQRYCNCTYRNSSIRYTLGFFFCLYKIKYRNKIIKEIEKRNKTQTNRYQRIKEMHLKKIKSKFLNEAISTGKKMVKVGLLIRFFFSNDLVQLQYLSRILCLT